MSKTFDSLLNTTLYKLHYFKDKHVDLFQYFRDKTKTIVVTSSDSPYRYLLSICQNQYVIVRGKDDRKSVVYNKVCRFTQQLTIFGLCHCPHTTNLQQTTFGIFRQKYETSP